MNNHQRGIYQPLAENAPLYDLSDDEGEEEEERSRLPLMIVIALVVLAAFTGVVWLAYNQGVARGRNGNTVVINAPDGPVRVAPSDGNGGAAFTGLKIYNQPVPPDQEAEASALAPAPTKVASAAPASAPPPRPATSEAPQVRLDPGPPAAPPRPAAQSAAPAAPAAPTARPAPAAPAVAQAAPPPAAPPPAPARPAVAQATPPAAAPPPAPARPAISQAAPAAPQPAAPPPPAAATTPASGGSVAVSGGAVLQIGSFENLTLAEGAWKTFKARHPDVVGELSEDIQKADLGARGTFYRLRAGPFKDRPAAVAVCEKLKTQGASCLVTAP